MQGNDILMAVPAQVVGKACRFAPGDPLGWLREAMQEAIQRAEAAQGEPSIDEQRPLVWGGVEFPPGTRFRAETKGESHDAVVNAEGDLIWNGRAVTPATFANRASGTTRNAWLFLMVRRPGDPDFALADKLRQSA
jgi:hypothetical protein